MKYCIKCKNVFTGNNNTTEALSILIENDVITEVVNYGTEGDYMDSSYNIIDFGDYMVMPGIIDAHTHFYSGAMVISDYVCSSIEDAESEEECAKLVKEYADAHPELDVIRGNGWFIQRWDNPELPTKASLDALIPDRPVYLRCADAHSYWLNSKALEQCHIDKNMIPASGYIGLLDNGELSGLLVEPDAYAPADRIFNSFNDDDMKKILKSFFKTTAQYGITGVSEMFGEDYTKKTEHKCQILKDMEINNELTARVHFYTRLFDYTDFSTAIDWKKKYDSPYMDIAGVKGFLDGVTETYTGMLLEPYSDNPKTCGIGVPLKPYESVRDSIIAANAAGLQVRLHCIADGSVRMALDIFKESAEKNTISGLHNTIEHIENINAADIPRFKELDVMPSMQPAHLVLDNNGKFTRLGAVRIKNEWMFKTMYAATDNLAIGTDFPVVDINPFKTIFAAVSRHSYQDKPTGFNPEECMTMAQVLTGYTRNAARAYNSEAVTGTIEPGKYADIIAVDRNLFNIESQQILDSKVIFTMTGGRIVYQKKEEEK